MTQWPVTGSQLVNYLKLFHLDINIKSIEEVYLNTHLREAEHYIKTITLTEVNQTKREYRSYTLQAANVVARVKTMIDFFDLSHDDIKSLRTDSYKVLEHIKLKPTPLLSAVHEKMEESKNASPDTWFDDLNWKELYRFCKTYDELDSIINEVILDLDIDEVEAELQDELYESIVEEFEEDCEDIELFDESTASEDVKQEFYQYFHSRINEELDIRCQDTIVDQINSKMNLLQTSYELPSFLKYYTEHISQLLADKRRQNKVRRKVDDVLGTLDFFDLHFLSILFLGECNHFKLLACLGHIDAFSDLKVEGFEAIYNDYVNSNYQNIRACSEYLQHDYYKDRSIEDMLTKEIETIKNIAYNVFKLPSPW